MPIPSTARVGYSAFTFDPKVQRFRAPNGRFMPPSQVRAIIDDDIEVTGDRLVEIGRQLKRGDISLEEFREKLSREIKALHLAEVATARGGLHRMDSEAYGRAGERIRYHYRALDGMCQHIQDYPEMLTDEGHPERMDFEERLRLYASAGRNSYARSKDIEMKRANFKSKANKLEPLAHHCTGNNSCPAMTALGRVAIDDPRYVMEGDRTCGPKCECETEYYLAAA